MSVKLLAVELHHVHTRNIYGTDGFFHKLTEHVKSTVTHAMLAESLVRNEYTAGEMQKFAPVIGATFCQREKYDRAIFTVALEDESRPNESHVTCKRCLAAIAKLKARGEEITWGVFPELEAIPFPVYDESDDDSDED